MDFRKLTVNQIAELLEDRDKVSVRWIKALLEDHRPGVQKLGIKYQRRQSMVKKENLRLDKMLLYEKNCFEQGIRFVAGVDEVGRGPLAGPVVAAAVILPAAVRIPYLNDSKKLSCGKREELSAIIKEKAVAWAVGMASVSYIDRRNIYHASIKAMENAVNLLTPFPEFVLVDALRLPGVRCSQKAVIHGDALSASIAAASIIAKVTRDQMMEKYEERYPGYGFANHKGYCTREHVVALKDKGPCAIHRRSFQIVRELAEEGQGGQTSQESWEW